MTAYAIENTAVLTPIDAAKMAVANQYALPPQTVLKPKRSNRFAVSIEP